MFYTRLIGESARREGSQILSFYCEEMIQWLWGDFKITSKASNFLLVKKALHFALLSDDVFLSTTKSTLQWLDHFPMTIKIWVPSPWIKYFSLSISLLRMYKILVHYLHGAISILPYKARNQKRQDQTPKTHLRHKKNCIKK